VHCRYHLREERGGQPSLRKDRQSAQAVTGWIESGMRGQEAESRKQKAESREQRAEEATGGFSLLACCCLLSALCLLLPAFCSLPAAACFLLSACCFLLSASCFLLPALYSPTPTRSSRSYYFTPPPYAFAICCSLARAFSNAWSMLKLAGFWRGGNSWNVLRNSPTIACAGTSRNERSATHLS